MMVALLVYACCTGVHSSRRIEPACHNDVAFRVMMGDAQPYFTTIDEFRRVRRERFAALFVQVLKLCREAGLVKLRPVAIDRTKVRAKPARRCASSGSGTSAAAPPRRGRSSTAAASLACTT